METEMIRLPSGVPGSISVSAAGVLDMPLDAILS